MAILSVRSRRRLWEISLTGVIVIFAWLVQLTVLSVLTFSDVLASLPLTFTIVWGSIFGSPMKSLTPEDLRTKTFGQIVTHQALSGSLSGLLVGAFFAALYSSVLPVYPISYPLVGWMVGYFSLKNFSQATILCLPVVLISTVVAESVMALQLAAIGRPDTLSHLASVVFPEALLNALMSPFIFFPMRGWYEFAQHSEVAQD